MSKSQFSSQQAIRLSLLQWQAKTKESLKKKPLAFVKTLKRRSAVNFVLRKFFELHPTGYLKEHEKEVESFLSETNDVARARKIVDWAIYSTPDVVTNRS